MTGPIGPVADPGAMPPAEGDGAAPPGVAGERGTALVGAVRSLQSRFNTVAAAGLMGALGVSGLTWYYAHAYARQQHRHEAAQSAIVARAQGEMPLPPLGRIDPPVPAAPAVLPETSATVAEPGGFGGEDPDLPLAEPAGPPAHGPVAAGSGVNAAAGGSAEPPGDRRLAGGVFAHESHVPASPGAAVEVAPRGGTAGSGAGAGTRDAGTAGADLPALLHSEAAPAVRAQRLASRRLVLPRGAFIDCTLETAIDSTLPGMTTCVTATDTFGADGSVVLLERGTKLVGETRGQVQQGQARVFVVWTQARTPGGVVVPLDSPGTDELGRAGLPGEVRRHFWQRFGAAMLISLLDGTVQAGVQAASRSGGTVVYAPSGSQEVLSEVLKETVRIAPTVLKRNGDRIQVLVARDLDFRDVYELRNADAATR